MYFNRQSCYSFRNGSLTPEVLIREAVQRNLEGSTLADINNASTPLDFFHDALAGDGEQE